MVIRPLGSLREGRLHSLQVDPLFARALLQAMKGPPVLNEEGGGQLARVSHAAEYPSPTWRRRPVMSPVAHSRMQGGRIRQPDYDAFGRQQTRNRLSPRFLLRIVQ